METSKFFCEHLIIGAGPAGLQLGYFFEKNNRDYLILEAGDTPGTFFKQFPRHRKLISSNKVYTGYTNKEMNLRWDWNSLLSDSDDLLFKRYSKQYFPPADDLVRYLKDFADFYNLKIKYGARVNKISKGEGFKVFDEQGNEYSCLRLIIASGFTKPYIPSIPGIELVEQYTEVSVDPKEFVNQKVLVLGKGNSGFEVAENLLETTALIHVASPNSIKMAWKTHFVGHLRAVNNNLLDTYQLKTQNAVIDATIAKIERRDGKFAVSVTYTHADGESEELFYDRVIACTGFRFDSSIFDDTCSPSLTINDRFPNQTCEWESTNIKDLYFAGGLTQMRDFKKTTSGFIHGFRYNCQALYYILEKKYHNNPWPSQPLKVSSETITDAIIKSVNESSALWQQFGFLCDLIAILQDSNKGTYYKTVPVDYVLEKCMNHRDSFYLITLEFGMIEGDPFSIVRYPDPSQAKESTFLHPVIRYYSRNKFVSELHILENLYSEWLSQDAHIQPLLDFVNKTRQGELLCQGT
jgi:thioredoxin reductase